MIRSLSNSNSEIMLNIMQLHNGGQPFEADVTYSKGVFYKDGTVPAPRLKFDLSPQTADTVQASTRALPIADGMLQSIIFDPPFIVNCRPSAKSKIANRFSSFSGIESLWTYYDESLKEFYRILKPNGLLAFKCQDTINSGKNYMSHIFIANKAMLAGFYMKDLFILTAKSRLIDPRWKNQQHARKYHSYWLVFVKQNPYTLHGVQPDENANPSPVSLDSNGPVSIGVSQDTSLPRRGGGKRVAAYFECVQRQMESSK